MNNQNTPYSLLVFDWDGTLIDSIEQITSSLQAASKIVCNEEISEDAARSVIGLGLQEAVERLHPDKEMSLVEKMADTYRHHYLHENDIPSNLFEGVTEMLAELKGKGFTLAIATGKSRSGLDHSIAEHDVAHYFSTTRCAGEYRSKPHPEMLQGIVNDTRTKLEHTLMIGDSEHDLMMANNAGVSSVAVTHGAHTADRLMEHKPLLCLDRVSDLTAFLSE